MLAKILSIILSSLSAIAVIMAILFEGQINSKDKKVDTWKALINSFKNLSKFGIFLLFISVLMSIGNGANSYFNIVENDNKYKADTAKNNSILRELKEKRKIDSLTIYKLSTKIENNGLKSDSIRLEVVNNAIKAMEEQNFIIERERENIFIHFKNEIEDNLSIIYLKYKDETLDGFKNDSSHFISNRLSSNYIDKFTTILNDEEIIDNLMELLTYIDKVNLYADMATKSVNDLKGKSMNINMMKKNRDSAKAYLKVAYFQSNGLKTYKDLNYSVHAETYDDTTLSSYFFMKAAIRNNAYK